MGTTMKSIVLIDKLESCPNLVLGAVGGARAFEAVLRKLK